MVISQLFIHEPRGVSLPGEESESHTTTELVIRVVDPDGHDPGACWQRYKGRSEVFASSVHKLVF